MIDSQFINNAKIIRSEFLSLMKSLNKYEKEVEKLAEFYQNISRELEEYNDTLRDVKNISEVQSYLIGKMNELEIESQKLTNKITPINERIEKLRNEEHILYGKIKEKYPNISDEDLVKEISQYL